MVEDLKWGPLSVSLLQQVLQRDYRICLLLSGRPQSQHETVAIVFSSLLQDYSKSCNRDIHYMIYIASDDICEMASWTKKHVGRDLILSIGNWSDLMLVTGCPVFVLKNMSPKKRCHCKWEVSLSLWRHINNNNNNN